LTGNLSRFHTKSRPHEESNLEIKDNLKFIENLLVDNEEDSTLFTTFSHDRSESFANENMLNLPDISAINDSRFFFQKGSRSKEFNSNPRETLPQKKND